MRSLRPHRILGLVLPLACAGCGLVGGVASAGAQLIQLAFALAAMALPFAAWYYYYRNQD